ncbi:hypothetical protein [Streptacidiphilus anmyonensis]|uniref:hypothetical protein n=1 Tax=Streptacidiphilus anmyonensis TaxID=405782 RepID=UPI000B0DC7AB|nr:hypothetical protein [Streptacidiphilus anmyonensis]
MGLPPGPAGGARPRPDGPPPRAQLRALGTRRRSAGRDLTRRWVDEPGIAYSEFADYDLGQAVAHLTVQAQALGLAAHQFRAFDLDGLTAELRPAPGWEIVSMLAVGRAVDEPSVARGRRSVADLVTAPFRAVTEG